MYLIPLSMALGSNISVGELPAAQRLDPQATVAALGRAFTLSLAWGRPAAAARLRVRGFRGALVTQALLDLLLHLQAPSSPRISSPPHWATLSAAPDLWALPTLWPLARLAMKVGAGWQGPGDVLEWWAGTVGTGGWNGSLSEAEAGERRVQSTWAAGMAPLLQRPILLCCVAASCTVTSTLPAAAHLAPTLAPLLAVFEAWEHALACMPCVGRLAPQPSLPSRAAPQHHDTRGFGANGVHGNGGFANGVPNGFPPGKPPTMHRMPTGHLPSPVAEEVDGSLESGHTGSTNHNSMLRGS